MTEQTDYNFIPVRSQRCSWMIGLTQIENFSCLPSSLWGFFSISLSFFIEQTSSSDSGKRIKSLSRTIFASPRRSSSIYPEKTSSTFLRALMNGSLALRPRTIFLRRSAKGRARPRERLKGLARITRLSSRNRVNFNFNISNSYDVKSITHLQYFYVVGLF